MIGQGLIAVGQVAFAFLAMGLAGRGLLGGRLGPGVQVMAGWGALCLLLTLWGVLTPWSLRLPAGLFLLGAAAAVLVTRRLPWREDAIEIGRLLALALPLLAVLAPMEASQLDVFALILPNSAYLFDHGVFPTALGPAAYSDAPVAPYNVALIPFLGSLAGGGFAPSGVAQATVWLHFPMALLFGRVLSRGDRPGWGMTAFALLLATVINPGFVPRVSFAGYGEAPLAICLAFALWLGAHVVTDEARRPERIALALVLAALVAVKQQGIGLFLSLGIAGMVVAATIAAGSRRHVLCRLFLAALPAITLYLAWRAHVVLRFPMGELISDTAGAWRDARLTEILRDMAWVAGNKLYLFGAFALVTAAALRPPAVLSAHTRTLARLWAVSLAFFTLFLLAVFMLHFGREHSYFRYNTQLSLAAVLALAAMVLDGTKGRSAPSSPARRCATALSILLMLGAPPAAWILLRFDRDQPQPQLRFLARHLAEAVAPDDRIVLILPGDNSTSGMALESLLRNTHPRRPNLVLRHVQHPTPDTLNEAAKAGFDLALLSCTEGEGALILPPGLPARSAVLLRRAEGIWRPTETWTYPDPGRRGKWGWSNFIAEEPFCMGPQR